MKRKIVDNYMLFIMLVVLAFVLYIGFTFAWFKPDVDGEGKNMLVETGNLSLHFQDGPEIIAKEIMPGWTTSKTFTVTNTGTLSTYYTLWWKDFENTFKNDEFVYSLTCTSYSDYNTKTEGGNCYGFDEKPVTTSGDLRILSNINIAVGYTHEYTMTVEYIETPYVQNYNQGQRFHGIINIKEYYENENDVPVVSTYNLTNNVLSATISDTYGITDYALTYRTASLSADNINWISVDDKKEFNLVTEITSYKVLLWIRNKLGNVVYYDLTPKPTLNVNPNGGTWDGKIATQTYNMIYDETKLIMDPIREGYTFTGWTLESNGTESTLINGIFTMGEKNTTLTANWNKQKYKLTINPNGGKYNNSTNVVESSVEYDSDVQISTPTRTGYTFTGWTISSKKAVLNTNTLTIGKEDCRLTATWIANTYPWVAYHNKMNTDGSGYTLVEADTERGSAEYGNKVIPSVKTYIGFNSPSAIDLTISEIESNNVVNYYYERQKYGLMINPNGGTYEGSTSSTIIPIYYQNTITISSPTRTGYNFVNWFLSGSGTFNDSVFTGGIATSTLIAIWSPIESIVSFNVNGGSETYSDKIVTYDQTYGELPTPSRDGYLFNGWYTSASGGTQITSSTVVSITSSQVLYAQWTRITPVGSYSCANGSSGTSPFFLTYNGDCEVIDDGSGNWRVKLLTSGTLNVSSNAEVDMFSVGGGGGGGANYSSGSNTGGGGGYTKTFSNIIIESNKNYNVTIGDGGVGNNARGGHTYFINEGIVAMGGFGGTNAYRDLAGGDGGSGGGGARGANASTVYSGGEDGNNGGGYTGYISAGQGTTTREFGEGTGTLYSGGGGAYNGNGGGAGTGGAGGGGDARENGEENTGGGGGGTNGSTGTTGGSGIIVLRNAKDKKESINIYNNFSYTGEYLIINDGEGKWRIKFLTSGTFIPSMDMVIDVFAVGGGGAGGPGNNSSSVGSRRGGGGGGGGYTETDKLVMLSAYEPYDIVIGAGGTDGNQAGTTSGFGVEAEGGYAGGTASAGNGGSSGGWNTNPGGSDGATTAAVGQGTTTREFGEADGDLYAGGGGSGGGDYLTTGPGGAGGGGMGDLYKGYSGMYAYHGLPNTGGGGGGATWNNTCGNEGGIKTDSKCRYQGGSGILIIRNADTGVSTPVIINGENIGTYSGNILVEEDGNDWKIKFLTSGTLDLNKNLDIDIFLVGGGSGSDGNGGSGGYTKTYSAQTISSGKYKISIGAGGAIGGGAGKISYFGSASTYYANGGTLTAGGSGGGVAANCPNYCNYYGTSTNAGAGASDGNDGSYGTGQGYTTREFGESTGTMYAGGGGGASCKRAAGQWCGTGEHDNYCFDYSGCSGSAAAGGTASGSTDNTGGGGHQGGAGGSGIVIIRNKR